MYNNTDVVITKSMKWNRQRKRLLERASIAEYNIDRENPFLSPLINSIFEARARLDCLTLKSFCFALAFERLATLFL